MHTLLELLVDSVLIDCSAFTVGIVVIELIIWRLLEFSAPFNVFFIEFL